MRLSIPWAGPHRISVETSVCWIIVKIRSKMILKISIVQGGPKNSTVLRVDNFATANITEVCDASERLKHAKQLSVKKSRAKSRTLTSFVSLISTSLTRFISINVNHFCCPSGRVIGLALHYCVKMNELIIS